MTRILTIRCSRCHAKIFKYLKVGSGRLWHCWKSRILEDYSVREGERVLCPRCGLMIGFERKDHIKLIKGRYKY